MNNSLISYSAFLKDRINFINAGTKYGEQLNIYDTPSHSFFKLLFCFYNGDSDQTDIISSGGLLAPTWEYYNSNDKLYNHNSAWAFLKNNDENERAEKLKQFINLLSNINCNSPWYFTEIVGVDEAINRFGEDHVVKFEDTRKKITIKCIADSFDQRIETLLNLYRDIVWSWSNKKEIVPANLRKFDMALYIWESPIYSYTTNSSLDETDSNYTSSYKLLEFHNCEFDYNAVKTGYSSLDNKNGIQKEFSIDIYFDDCYEHSYNSLIMRTIGDVITTDTAIVINDDDGNGKISNESLEQGSENSYYNNTSKINMKNNMFEEISLESSSRKKYWDEYIKSSESLLNEYFELKKLPDYDEYELGNLNQEISIELLKNELLPGYKGSYKNKGFVGNIVGQAIGAVEKGLETTINRFLLGNLYTYSISRMSDQLKGVLNGQISTAIDAVDQYTGANIGNTLEKHSIGNLTAKIQKNLNDINRKGQESREGSKINSPINRTDPPSNRDIFPSIPYQKPPTTLGNLYKAKTLINNI